MGFPKLIAAIALSLLVTSASRADDVLHIDDAQNLNGLRQPWELLPVEQAAYAEVTDMNQFSVRQPDIDETNLELTIGCCEECDGDESRCGDINYRSGWTVEFDVSGMRTSMAATTDNYYSQTTDWPDEIGTAGRLIVGYEWGDGIGIRAQTWWYFLEGIVEQRQLYYYPWYSYEDRAFYPTYATSRTELEIEAGTIYFDFFKSVVSRNSELLFGVGPAFGSLKLFLRTWSELAQFRGGGVSAFGHVFLPCIHHNNWQLGVAGGGRVALLAGGWEDYRGYSLNKRSNNMSVLELAAGLELRRSFGRSADHYLYLRAMPEFQQWTSDGMGPFGGDTLALQGASLNFGVNW